MTNEEKPVNIDTNTRISFGVFKEAQTYLLVGCVWLIVNMESIKHRLDDIEHKLPQTWTRADQRSWALDFSRVNREIEVPIPQER